MMGVWCGVVLPGTNGARLLAFAGDWGSDLDYPLNNDTYRCVARQSGLM